MERQIDQTYVQKGIVRIGYIQMTFLGQESVWAAEAAECADEQGAFWAYRDYLLSNQKGENKGAFNRDNLKQFAVALKLDAQAFNSCMDSGRTSATVEKEAAFAEYLGVPSTPTFLLNGQPLVGGQTFATFQKLIDAAAKP